MTRDELITTLWPTDHAIAPNRLSVVLTTLRSVLAGSRTDREPGLVSERTMVRLDLGAVDIDLEHFSRLATRGLEAWRRRDPQAFHLLRTATAAYTGDFCADDQDKSWAIPLREELAMTYAAALRALAAAARESGHPDLARQSLLTLLRRDPYDEASYLELVNVLQATGRYDEARRHYRHYTERMQEIAVHPQPMSSPIPTALTS